MTSPSAALRRAHEASIAVRFRNFDFVLEPAATWAPQGALELKAGRLAAFLRVALGAEQFADLEAARPSLGDLLELGEIIAKASGLRILGKPRSPRRRRGGRR
jgi:hypothetical protein